MEGLQALQANIIATCPLPFQGNGELFARAVTAVVAAHCTFFDDYQWPRDDAEDVILNGPREFDFIVVGAGTAGSALAGLLAGLNPSWTVLLVEAGDNPTLNSEVPAFLMENHNMNWKYQTKQDNRSCLGFTDNRCLWSKGKALGGSSALNAMLYTRGHPRDYEKWKRSGNPGWGYEDLSPYFEAIETKFNLDKYEFPDNPWYSILEAAYKEVGIPSDINVKNLATTGTKKLRLTTRDGKRLNSAKMYLKESDNFYVMKNTVVEQLDIDPDTLRAKGVLLRNNNGEVMLMQAKNEIILSAGSIATPNILMASGIGPRAHLNEKGLECLNDLPVGQNLQDHILIPLLFKTKLNITVTPAQITYGLLQYMLEKTGPFSNIGLTDLMSFINTKNDSSYPNIQLFHVYFTKNDQFTLRPYYEGFGFKKEIVDMLVEKNKDSDILGIFPTLLHPKSRGEIRLSDSNNNDFPNIVTNYFQDKDDIKVLQEAIKFTKKLKQTEIFKSLDVDTLRLDLPNCKGLLFDSDEYWECYIRNMGATIYHPVGTVKMGPKDESTSVVNHNLLIHGMPNLRVVDASIMPHIPGGNTMAPTLVIAEKAFDIIRKHFSFKDEL